MCSTDRNAEAAANERKAKEKKSLFRKVSNWLGTIDIQVDYERYKNERYQNTCDWILQNVTFEKWVSASTKDDGFPLLWIHAIPGAGKTYLSARCVELLEDCGTVAYFFCNTAEQRKRTVLGVLRTWVWQLLQKDPDGVHELEDMYNRGEVPNQINLTDALRVLLRRSSSCWLVLDGLDECEPVDRGKLLEICGSVVSDTKLLITSRNEDDIAERISKLNSSLHRTIRIDPSDNEADIKSYLDDKVKGLPGDDDLKMEISSKLSAGAKGMFLWVVLMIEDLSSSFDTEELEESLENLPDGLDVIYARVLDRINSFKKESQKQKARVLLQWIACAAQPLSIFEIGSAMAITYDEDEFNGKRAITDPKRFISQCCGPLVDIGSTDSIVRIAHASVKDFLLSQSQLTSISSYLVDEKEAHNHIARSCLTYISYKNNEYVVVNEDYDKSVANLDKRIKDNRFLRYAVLHWWRHVLSTPIRNGLETTLGRFLTSEFIAVYWLQIFHRLVGDTEAVNHFGPNPNVYFFSNLIRVRDSWHEVSSEKKTWVDKIGQAGEGRSFRW